MSEAFHLVMTLALDGLVAVLLGVTIYYCGKLNKRIRILQDSKSELAGLIMKFDESTQMATRSIHEIHNASKKINESIQTKLDKANYIADDLSFMIERGNRLADQMEGQISASRGRPAGAPRPEANQARREEASVEEMTREVAGGASKLADIRRGRPAPQAAEVTDKQKRTNALESVLEKISSTKAGKAAEAPAKQEEAGKRRVPTARMRSQAEQELLDALKTERS